MATEKARKWTWPVPALRFYIYYAAEPRLVPTICAASL